MKQLKLSVAQFEALIPTTSTSLQARDAHFLVMVMTHLRMYHHFWIVGKGRHHADACAVQGKG